MNIAQLRAAAVKLTDGANEAIARIEDKEKHTEKDVAKLDALYSLVFSIEGAMEELDSVWED